MIAGITISLDGFVTGPNDRLGAGLGDGGERLHYWVFGAGKPLFEGLGRTDLGFERFETIESPCATHLRFRVA